MCANILVMCGDGEGQGSMDGVDLKSGGEMVQIMRKVDQSMAKYCINRYGTVVLS